MRSAGRSMLKVLALKGSVAGKLGNKPTIRGLGGLRVADASIMPDVIRANTNATSIMIGERVAEWMVQER